MPASHIAIYNDLRGPSNSITLREASANLAVSEAYCTIVRGHADTILAGATGTRLHPAAHGPCGVAGGTGDRRRTAGDSSAVRSTCIAQGMVLGEGAAAVVVEELETAQRRGAHDLGRNRRLWLVRRHGPPGPAEPRGRRCRMCMRQVAARRPACPPTTVGPRPRPRPVHPPLRSAGSGGDPGRVWRSRRPIPVTALKSYQGNLGVGAAWWS